MINQEFFKKVLNDFETRPQKSVYFLCKISNDFYLSWNSEDKNKIVELARIFLKENSEKYPKEIVTTFAGFSILFVAIDGLPKDQYEFYAEIRHDFLKWAAKQEKYE